MARRLRLIMARRLPRIMACRLHLVKVAAAATCYSFLFPYAFKCRCSMPGGMGRPFAWSFVIFLAGWRLCPSSGVPL